MRRRTDDQMAADQYGGTATEAEWQATVVDLARTLGWLVVHIRAMEGNEAGIPDLLLYRGNRYELIELKAERGAVSIKQQMWHARAADRGVLVRVWRPSDFAAAQEVLA